MKWINQISTDARVSFYLVLAEKVIPIIEGAEGYPKAREALDRCWEWVEYKTGSGDQLYELLDDEFTGIEIYAQLEKDPQKSLVWVCIGYALAYTIRKMYEHEGEKYFPEPINLVDEELIDYFMEAIRGLESYQDQWNKELESYLTEHYFDNGEEALISKKEMMSVLSS
ncbi:hypothetical protein GXN76_09130 [Kroppenstedtia pulmonis]|uniref:Immunity protein Imm6 n=1 Tax=Kroppenstedtia pulmonis TaxID=1380685 RepID=A0A7D3Y225_9BACL|nr:Imm6 family immunity protein [Kroppenstedtia pulmonis]QKG84623.1 hypothetical protein GXN76_09130 [Kroppenstedtia pulmonis]